MLMRIPYKIMQGKIIHTVSAYDVDRCFILLKKNDNLFGISDCLCAISFHHLCFKSLHSMFQDRSESVFRKEYQ